MNFFFAYNELGRVQMEGLLIFSSRCHAPFYTSVAKIGAGCQK